MEKGRDSTDYGSSCPSHPWDSDCSTGLHWQSPTKGGYQSQSSALIWTTGCVKWGQVHATWHSEDCLVWGKCIPPTSPLRKPHRLTVSLTARCLVMCETQIWRRESCCRLIALVSIPAPSSYVWHLAIGRLRKIVGAGWDWDAAELGQPFICYSEAHFIIKWSLSFETSHFQIQFLRKERERESLFLLPSLPTRRHSQLRLSVELSQLKSSPDSSQIV